MDSRKLILFTLLTGAAGTPSFALDLTGLSQDVTVSALPVPVSDTATSTTIRNNAALPVVNMPQPQITATAPSPAAVVSDANVPSPNFSTGYLPSPEKGPGASIAELYPPQSAANQPPASGSKSADTAQAVGITQYDIYAVNTATTPTPVAPAAPVTSPADVPAANIKNDAAPQAVAMLQPAPAAANDTVSPESLTKLGSGNKIKIKVFGEEELSGEFEIDAGGNLSLPLIGTVQASGLEPRALEELITAKLKEGYLINPLLSLEILNYKPIFILGEINHPGSYAYTTGLTVINAVALGGGFTNRARKGSVTIIRTLNDQKTELEGTESTLIYPGDTIRVNERWF